MKKMTNEELELYATSHLDVKVQSIAHELISSREIIEIIDKDNDELRNSINNVYGDEKLETYSECKLGQRQSMYAPYVNREKISIR